MDVSFEDQIKTLAEIRSWHLRRMTPVHIKAVDTTQQTLSRLIELRQRLQNADHADEAQSDQMAEDVLRLLGLPRS